MTDEIYYNTDKDKEFFRFTPTYTMVFWNEDREIGKLDFSSGVMEFSGDIAESAKVFFEYLKDKIIDPYMNKDFKKEEYNFFYSDDDTCVVVCNCGEEVWVTSSDIAWCKCGAGFKSKFDVLSYRK